MIGEGWERCGPWERIKRDIHGAKPTPWDKWFRRQWYRAGAGREGRARRAGELSAILKVNREISAARPKP
jgi:hypothetical protein